MTSSFIQMASLPDRENLVVEVWINNTEICEVSFEDVVLSCLRFSNEPVSEDEQDLIEQAVSRLKSTYDIGEDTILRNSFYRSENQSNT